ncbi:hypothetical protein X943_004083 [Babesia divergens]|uniref:Uncharacterized protein n=1 Tax=Babesia divergens TaxID=32595 RepID=A0AAD9GGI9_BABDI|nr:hypothetical protein X943_004083 [Babesia divergens]
MTTNPSKKERHECPLHPRRATSVSQKVSTDDTQREAGLTPSSNLPMLSKGGDVNRCLTSPCPDVDEIFPPTEHVVDVATNGTGCTQKTDSSRSPSTNIASEEEPIVDKEQWQARWSLKNLLNPENNSTSVDKMMARHIPKPSPDVKLLCYQLERSERIIGILKRQLAERDESIAKMLTHVTMLEEWKDELDKGQKTLANEREDEIRSIMSVMDEKYRMKHQECQTLKSKLLAMEQDHMLKDGELRKLQLALNELKLNESKLVLRLDSMKADREIVAKSIQRLKLSYKERQVNMQLALDRQYQEQAMHLIEQIESEKRKVAEKSKKIRDGNLILKRAEHECSKLVAATIELKEALQEKDEELKRMTYAMLDLEECVVKNDQNASSRIYATKALLDSVRREKTELKSNNRILMKELANIRSNTAAADIRDLIDESRELTDLTKQGVLQLTIKK